MTSSTPDSSRRHVVLGVAGGIAAYKAVELLRRLTNAGLRVTPVLTAEAAHFVGPLTFTALAGESARSSLFSDPDTPIPHTRLGQSAELVVIAPATAHLIARLAAGFANDLLTATVLATRAKVVIAPAMHTEMWEQPSVQANLATLRARGVVVVGPATGQLAGGDAGAGRMVEPEEIESVVHQLLYERAGGPLSGIRVLVSAGGTREPIDPVRVITNRSSGRQGYALAEVAARLGAKVTLVTAARLDLSLDVVGDIDVVEVNSASDMASAVLSRSNDHDVVIMAAAVADFTPVPAGEKLKKESGVPTIALQATTDILAELGQRRRTGQVLVGFAAETTNVRANAIAKLQRKGCDLLVVNDVSAPGVGFDHPTNEVVIFDANGSEEQVSLRSKEQVAEAILANVATKLKRGTP